MEGERQDKVERRDLIAGAKKCLGLFEGKVFFANHCCKFNRYIVFVQKNTFLFLFRCTRTVRLLPGLVYSTCIERRRKGRGGGCVRVRETGVGGFCPTVKEEEEEQRKGPHTKPKKGGHPALEAAALLPMVSEILARISRYCHDKILLGHTDIWRIPVFLLCLGQKNPFLLAFLLCCLVLLLLLLSGGGGGGKERTALPD